MAPQRELVARLAAGAVEVVELVPPGGEVETFAPTPRQRAALERAALVFWVDHPAFLLEARLLGPWLASHPEVPRVALADHVPSAPGPPATDPHLWTSPRTMRAAARELAGRLADLLPATASEIAGRAALLDADLAALDARLATRLAGGGSFLIVHPALGHLARDYGLVEIALEAEGKEPTAAAIGRLVARARDVGYRAVLVLRGQPRRSGELLARELGAALVEIDPVAADWLANTERIAVALAGAVHRD